MDVDADSAKAVTTADKP